MMTPEHKAKLAEGRRLARERKLAAGEPLRRSKKKELMRDGKPVIHLTGKEENAFDFATPLRNTYRQLKMNNEVDGILHQIVDKDHWQDVEWVKEILSKYVIFA
jgi:hypothetical protein